MDIERLNEKYEELQQSFDKFKKEIRQFIAEQAERCHKHDLTTHEHTLQINQLQGILDEFGGNIKDLNSVLTNFIHSLTADLSAVKERSNDADKFKISARNLIVSVLLLFIGYLIARGG